VNPLLHDKNAEQIKQIEIIKIYSGKHCLVIDDFPEIRGSLTRLLKTFGSSHVDTAANGEEAIRACSKRKYDIVLCDYNLGSGKDGQQILEEIRHLRVLLMTSLFVIITGESSREMVLGALESQPDDYITKPYTPASLKLRLDKAIVRHEALIDIKHQISDGDYSGALDLCNEMIAAGSRYAHDILKIKAQLHFLLKQLSDALKVYKGVVIKKPLVWARLGMGKTLIEMGDLDGAESIFHSLIAEDSRYIEAHDLLAEIKLKKRDTAAAQKALEDATHVSPKSVLRHRHLAQLADMNHDDALSLKSHQQSIKWGLNSCHESEQDYFNYARKVSEMTKNNSSPETKQLVKQAEVFLGRAKKRYTNRADVTTQAQMVETQILAAQGNVELAKASRDLAVSMYSNLPSPPIEVSLEYARSMQALSQDDEAHDLLTTLAARHARDPEILAAIDAIAVEPISEQGKSKTAELTREGISFYDHKNYDQAIKTFKQALFTYPKHMGLHLNLMQAIVADTNEHGEKYEHEMACKHSMRAIGIVDEQHKQFKRYRYLCKQLKKVYPSVLLAS